MIPRSLGSSLPVRSCACTANASRSAVTVTSTTTSVSINACTTGSTAGVPGGMSAKTGAPAPARKPIASSSTYVDDCTTLRQITMCTVCRLVTTPYNPTTNSQIATAYGNH